MKFKELKKTIEESGLMEKDPSVVGYVLFNNTNRRFATMDRNEFGMVVYVDDIENAYLAPFRFTGLMDLGSLPESDASNIAILPVVENPLFGLMLKNPV